MYRFFRSSSIQPQRLALTRLEDISNREKYNRVSWGSHCSSDHIALHIAFTPAYHIERTMSMRASYSERDSTFGQTMLTLRSVLGLTQAGLANYLGVSRRAVGEWEAGCSYPKAEHLKELITLGVKQQAFPVGHEVQEIRLLWKAAHQKVLLDERWLSALLSQRHAPLLHVVPPYVAEQTQDKRPVSLPTPIALVEETITSTPIIDPPTLGPRVDWSDALAVPTFYGREQEQALLSQWVVQEHCRVVSVVSPKYGPRTPARLAVPARRPLSPRPTRRLSMQK